MELNKLTDKELLTETKRLRETGRQTLTQILRRLSEIERRKVYCDLGYGSLFEYAVKELQYSEGQAGRRIQAMRLIKEIPEIESSIQSGALSLSNISQAQSIFRTLQKENQNHLKKSDKIDLLETLKNKSTREAQREILKHHPQALVSCEKERQVTPTATQVTFLMDDALKETLENIRSLLGAKGIALSFAELVREMANISAMTLKEKKFGKNRAHHNVTALPTTAQESDPKNTRYLSKAVQAEIWERDSSQCTNCGSKKNLNFDHITPFALGGRTEVRNLRLLCFHCNQRAAIKIFGIRKIGSGKHRVPVQNFSSDTLAN